MFLCISCAPGSGLHTVVGAERWSWAFLFAFNLCFCLSPRLALRNIIHTGIFRHGHGARSFMGALSCDLPIFDFLEEILLQGLWSSLW